MSFSKDSLVNRRKSDSSREKQDSPFSVSKFPTVRTAREDFVSKSTTDTDKFLRYRQPLRQPVEINSNIFVNCFGCKLVTMSIPTPLITGSIIYLLIGVLLAGGIFGAKATGQMSKDNAA
jgi:hypothetical protein